MYSSNVTQVALFYLKHGLHTKANQLNRNASWVLIKLTALLRLSQPCLSMIGGFFAIHTLNHF